MHSFTQNTSKFLWEGGSKKPEFCGCLMSYVDSPRTEECDVIIYLSTVFFGWLISLLSYMSELLAAMCLLNRQELLAATSSHLVSCQLRSLMQSFFPVDLVLLKTCMWQIFHP